MGSDRSLVAIAAGVIATVVAAVVIVVVLGDSPRGSFAADSPEATVQGYFTAWEDEDLEAAYAYFSSDIKRRVPFDEYRAIAGDSGGFQGGLPQRRVTIDKVEIEEARAEVYLGIEYTVDGGFPFLGAGYRDSRTIHLVREDGGWKVNDALVGLESGLLPPGGFPPDGFPPDAFPTAAPEP